MNNIELTSSIRGLCHLVTMRILNNPEKSHCSYRLGYNWVVAIKDHKTHLIIIYPLILN